ncbi:MAG: hypothetical protein AAGG51_10415 [Cyanobacteria bacterium P01_G01_bin.54]
MLTLYSAPEQSGELGQSPLRFQLCLYSPQAWRSLHLQTIPLNSVYHALPVTAALRYPDELLDYYLSLPKLRGREVRIGLNLQVDHQSWTNHASGQFWHLSQWFAALAQVLTTPENQDVHALVWEQSHLTLYRRRNALILRDAEVIDGFAWAPIRVSLRDFTQQLLQMARQFKLLIVLLNQAIALRNGLPPKPNADRHCRYRSARATTAANERCLNLLWREFNDFPDTMAQLQQAVTDYRPSWL